MAFNVKKRGKLTYYYQGEHPVLSSLVTEELPDGDLKISFAGLTGGYSAKGVLGLEELVTMDPQEIPLVFRCWEKWLREAGICDSLKMWTSSRSTHSAASPSRPTRWWIRWGMLPRSTGCARPMPRPTVISSATTCPTMACRPGSQCTSSMCRTRLRRTSSTGRRCIQKALQTKLRITRSQFPPSGPFRRLGGRCGNRTLE